MAGGRLMALFRFDAGYRGDPHEHTDAEFGYILDGEPVCNGVPMTAGCARGGTATTHEEFRTDADATILSVFQIP